MTPLTESQAAEQLGIPEKTLRNARYRHKIAYVKYGKEVRYSQKHLDDYTAACERKAGVDMFQISGILGHSHSRTTELYLKHHPDHLREGVDALSSGKQMANYFRHGRFFDARFFCQIDHASVTTTITAPDAALTSSDVI